jgi:hypothetical protein
MRFALLPLLGLVVSVAWLAGCGNNAAENGTDPDEQQASVEAAELEQAQLSESEQLAVRQQELNERLETLAQREAAIAERERATRRETEAERQRELARKRDSARTARRTAPPVAEPVVRQVSITLPASSVIEIEFSQELSSDDSQVGDPVEVVVVRDVVQDNRVVIPAGSQVTGEVTKVKSGRKIGGRSLLVLQFASLRLPDGTRYPIQSTIEYAGKSQAGKDAATIGGSTAGGALLGRVLSGGDKDKGTVIGAVVGAAVGTAVASKNGTDSVVILSGEIAELLLYESVRLTVQEPVPATAWAKN